MRLHIYTKFRATGTIRETIGIVGNKRAKDGNCTFEVLDTQCH